METVARLGNRREGERASVNNPGVENQDPESFTKHETPNACTPPTPCVDGEMAEGGRRAAVRGPWVVLEVALWSLAMGRLDVVGVVGVVGCVGEGGRVTVVSTKQP